MRSSSQQTYTEVLEASSVNWDQFEFGAFSHSDFDRVENQTLRKVDKPHASGTSSTMTLAELVQQGKVTIRKSYAGSVSSVSCESGSVVGDGSEHDQYTTMPSLTMNQTLPEKSETSLDAKIRRTETRLENLKKLKSDERRLTEEADTHDDWIGFVEPRGPPIDVENQSRVSKMLSRMTKLVSTSSTSASSPNRRKRRRLQNNFPSPSGLHTSSGLPAAASPAPKQVRAGEPPSELVTTSQMDESAFLFGRTDASTEWDHVFNYELYEAAI